jgi:hypothetical protein
VFLLVLSGVCLAAWPLVIIPKPEQLPVLEPKDSTVRLALTWNNGHAGLFSEMGITRDQFIAWCVGASLGRSLGENHVTLDRPIAYLREKRNY